MKNKISIVIPAFNEEALLPDCISSIKSQHFQGAFEIIVTDNGSTDGTARVAAELGARVISCPRRGVAYARQAGAMAASGDIIIQADADTVYPSGWLSRIDMYFDSHSQIVALAGNYVYQSPPAWAGIEYLARYLLNLVGIFVLGRPVGISGANFAFRKQAFFKTNGYDPKSLYPDQWGISHNLSRTGRVAFDRTLTVATSARRVQKPFHLILKDVFVNSARVFNYFVRHGFIPFRRPAVKLRRMRTSARRTVSMFLPVIVCLAILAWYAAGL